MATSENAAQLDHARLRDFLLAQGAISASAQLDSKLLSGGRSNLTYLLDIDAQRLVLRRPPLGHTDPRTHDVGREYKFLTALHPTGLPVAKPFAYCADATVIGAPFYIMQRIDGRTIESRKIATDLSSPEQLSELVDAVVDGLVALHAIDYVAVGLATIGKPEGFVTRQVRRWTEQWRTRQLRSIAALDEIGHRLATAVSRGLPVETNAPTIVHNDYNIGNLIVSERSPTALRAILDWEMATVGHPLLDLGLLVTYNGPHMNDIFEIDDAIACQPGFPSSNDIANRYATRSGRSIELLDFFVTLGFFKVLVLNEDVRSRFKAGSTVGEGYAKVGNSTPRNAEALLEYVQRSPIFGD